MPTDIIEDTIKFTTRADVTLVSERIKLIAQVTAQVASEITPEALGADIRNALRQYIPNAEWTFTNLRRAADDIGTERATLVATARVAERENYNLEQRARAASRPGLQITALPSDTSIPSDRLDKAEEELRAAIITKVSRECAAIREQTKRDYRIGRLVFSPDAAANDRKQGGGRGVAKMFYGSGFSDEDGGPLANATKLTMLAAVTLVVTVGARERI